MAATIEPQPSEEEREAILAALAAPPQQASSGWAEAALAEGVEVDELDRNPVPAFLVSPTRCAVAAEIIQPARLTSRSARSA